MVNSSRAEKRTSGSRDRSAPGFLATLAKRSSNGSSELRILWSWLPDLHLESPSADGTATCESGLEFPTSVFLEGAVSGFFGNGAHFFVHRFHQRPWPCCCVDFA